MTETDINSRQELIKAARGLMPADLVFKNGRLVDVLSGEIIETGVAVHRGRIAGIGDYDGRETINLEGRYLCPGFIDGHIHVESTMLTPPEFARAVVPLGTTSVIIDPHEIANVLGRAGIDYMLESSRGLPVTFYVMLPSCVPTSAMETSGAELGSAELEQMIGRERVIGIAEMMNYPGVLEGNPEVLARIAAAGGRRVDGHAPGLTGKDLAAYAGAGISSDHECVTAGEALEKLRLGMHILVREGSTARNLKDLITAITPENSRRFSFATDDRHPEDLIGEGHIDYLVRLAVDAGLPPVTAIQMASINTAVHYSLGDVGALAPGCAADILVLEDLSQVRATRVYQRGRLAAKDGMSVTFRHPKQRRPAQAAVTRDTINIGAGSIDFAVPAAGERLKAIEIVPDQIITKKIIIKTAVINGLAVADPERDILKLAVIERHRASGSTGLGFVKGFGLKRGSLASSVAHDSHNIISVGADDADMKLAVTEVKRMGGGFAVAAGGMVLAALPLPVAGLMSDQPLTAIATATSKVIAAAAELGCPLHDPFITLSFLALPVVPELKLTDKGLVDVNEFRIVELFE